MQFNKTNAGRHHVKTNSPSSLVRFTLSVLVLAALINPGVTFGQTVAPAATPITASTPAPAPAKPVKFRPQNVGAPAVRLTGGSRGTGADAVVLDVLTPDSVGMTTQEQPCLFWYQSKPANARFELTLLQEKQVKPLVHIQIERSSKAGIQRLRLADHGAKLQPGVEYQWVVALVTDPENRSTDLVASGVIKRIQPTPDLKERLKKTDRSAWPDVYAEAGVWYDALTELSDQIDANPKSEALRDARRDLLRQVGLKAAATF